jgi:hypothetical protein
VSTAAAILCKDEEDVIETTVRHLVTQVDEVVVCDNLSTDGTRDILDQLERELGIVVQTDAEVGFRQAEKTTQLAQDARARGHGWFIPVDADEIWYSGDGRRIADFLDGVSLDVTFVKAAILNHVATALDPEDEPNPVRRLGWRQRQPLAYQWWKVACRCRPDLEIAMGNHSARTHGPGREETGLEIRHFPYRSSAQFCNPPESPIWMADLSFKPIGDIQVGDLVMGAARVEDVYRTLSVPAEVEAVHTRRSEVVRVTFESGRWLRCTPDHLWRQHFYGSGESIPGLRGKKRSDGKGYQDVRVWGGDGTYLPPKVGRSLSHVITPTRAVATEDERLAGWLAGIFDGEGSSDGYAVQIAQSRKANPLVYQAICDALAYFGFEFTMKFDRINLTGGQQAYVDFFNITQPYRRQTTGRIRLRGTRRLRDVIEGSFGARYATPDRIIAVEPDGEGDVIGLTTTSGNYVAWGYASKNCSKAINGLAAYRAAPDLLQAGYGAHWKVYGETVEEHGPEAGEAWFYDAFFSRDPEADGSLVFDPAPVTAWAAQAPRPEYGGVEDDAVEWQPPSSEGGTE